MWGVCVCMYVSIGLQNKGYFLLWGETAKNIS